MRNLCFGMPVRFRHAVQGHAYSVYVTKPSEMDSGYSEEVLLGVVEAYRCGGGRSVRWRCFRRRGEDLIPVDTNKVTRAAAVEALYAARFGNPLITARRGGDR